MRTYHATMTDLEAAAEINRYGTPDREQLFADTRQLRLAIHAYARRHAVDPVTIRASSEQIAAAIREDAQEREAAPYVLDVEALIDLL